MKKEKNFLLEIVFERILEIVFERNEGEIKLKVGFPKSQLLKVDFPKLRVPKKKKVFNENLFHEVFLEHGLFQKQDFPKEFPFRKEVIAF